MRVFSLEFLIIFIVSILILVFKLRKKKGNTSIPRKYISIRGQHLETDIAKNTPLICLLSDGKNFGEDYHDKESPDVPHCDNCQCELIDVNHNSAEWFLDKNKQKKSEFTDLGTLTKAEKRYYKYILIAQHTEISKKQQIEYLGMAEQVQPVSEAFRMEVEAHLEK